MTESKGEIKAIGAVGERVILDILLSPEESVDPAQIWEWRIGERVKVVGNEPSE